MNPRRLLHATAIAAVIFAVVVVALQISTHTLGFPQASELAIARIVLSVLVVLVMLFRHKPWHAVVAVALAVLPVITAYRVIQQQPPGTVDGLIAVVSLAIVLLGILVSADRDDECVELRRQRDRYADEAHAAHPPPAG